MFYILFVLMFDTEYKYCYCYYPNNHYDPLLIAIGYDEIQ